ncbi:MAG: proton-conducting transporter membrane subunit [Akkermansia sp.]|nr:proton-conducting transporter membrane subunit [Akkermansia sp.]
MLIWLILIPVIAAALIGLAKAPGRLTALVSAAITLILGLGAVFCPHCGQCCCEPSALQFTVDPAVLPLAKVMLLLTVIVTFAAILGLKAPDKDAERSWSISALLLSTGAMGAFMSDNIIAFYGFHELALIPTFVMIGCYGRGDRRTISWTATIYLGLASMVLLAGLLLLCGEMHCYEFSTMAKAVRAGMMPEHTCLIGGLLLLGFGTLVSLFPFHSWAAPAYASAPTPIAMLHAGVLKKFGLYGLFTLAFIFTGGKLGEIFGGWNNILLVLLLGNVLWVGIVTIAQKRLDDMLGNSSVMHMGYLFLAFAVVVAGCGPVATEMAVKGAALLMLAHGLTIAMLFLLTGQIESQTRTLEMDAMGGLAQKLPWLGFLFGLAGLASIGLPLLANFPGEFTVFYSCFVDWHPGTEGCCALANWLGGLGPVQLTLVFALWGLVISAVYMLRAFRTIFNGDVSRASGRATKLCCLDTAAAIVLALAIVLFGILPYIVSNLVPTIGA